MYQNNRDRGSCIPPTNRKILGFVRNLISSILSTVTAVLLSNGRGSGFFPSYDEGALNRISSIYPGMLLTSPHAINGIPIMSATVFTSSVAWVSFLLNMDVVIVQKLLENQKDLLSVLQAPCVLGLRLRWCRLPLSFLWHSLIDF